MEGPKKNYSKIISIRRHPKGPLLLSFNADVLEFYFPRLFTKLANFFRHPKKDPKTKTVFALILYDLIAKLPSLYN